MVCNKPTTIAMSNVCVSESS